VGAVSLTALLKSAQQMRNQMKALALAPLFALCLGLGALTSCCAAEAAPTALCDCGVEKGAEGCCDAEAARCDGCGKIKGSAGCCK